MRDIPNVAIIGCGRMGQRRAKALGESARLFVCCDTDLHYAMVMAEQCDGTAIGLWKPAVKLADVDIVIVCTPPNVAPEIAAAAAKAGKHVLIEKPGATNSAILAFVAGVAASVGVKVRVGFNLRYHRAIRMARLRVAAGSFGDLMYVRGVYGHGGRLGMEKEWRCDPKVSGGGELMDQGVHLIDLSRWFLGELGFENAASASMFWDVAVEDNVWLHLRAENALAQLHASWTEWKNTFRFEIFGTKGKLQIDGLGGSYGTERLTLYQMRPEMGPPDTTIWEYPQPDDSFEIEWQEFLRDIREDREPSPGIADAQAALRIVEEVYAGR